jgi:hypothetical protein
MITKHVVTEKCRLCSGATAIEGSDVNNGNFFEKIAYYLLPTFCEMKCAKTMLYKMSQCENKSCKYIRNLIIYVSYHSMPIV